jgi:hypothetical protein
MTHWWSGLTRSAERRQVTLEHFIKISYLTTMQDNNRRNQIKSNTTMRALAHNSLGPIEKKLRGVYAAGLAKTEKEASVGNLVQTLIAEATDGHNLVSGFDILQFVSHSYEGVDV